GRGGGGGLRGVGPPRPPRAPPGRGRPFPPPPRDSLGAGAPPAAAAAGLATPAVPSLALAMPEAPRAPGLIRRSAGRPVIISSANGLRSKDASGRPAIQIAYDMMVRGADPLDAIVAGVQIVELDPTDNSAGLGGLPNEEG